MARLAGKRALVTGGTSGIGLAAAKRFVEEGARVAIAGSNPETLAKAKAELGADTLIIRADAADVVAQTDLARELGAAFGKLDAVFVNAGVDRFPAAWAWDEVASTGRSPSTSRGRASVCARSCRSSPIPPRSSSTCSIDAHIGMPNSSVYSLTKAGIVSLARTLSGELLDRVEFRSMSQPWSGRKLSKIA